MNRPRDLDAQLQRLLVEHYWDEEDGLRRHLETCPCCMVQARMISRLRVDFREMVGELLDELDKRRGKAT